MNELSADEFTLVNGQPTIVKAPGATKDYTVDFSAVIPDGVVIQSATVTGAGLVIGDVAIVGAGKMVQAWISGGHFNARLSATFTAQLSDGRTIDPRTLWFVMQATG